MTVYLEGIHPLEEVLPKFCPLSPLAHQLSLPLLKLQVLGPVEVVGPNWQGHPQLSPSLFSCLSLVSCVWLAS